MDKSYFLAKSSSYKNGLYKTETIEEHTNNLLYLYESFKKLYKNYFTEKEFKLIEMACQIHDLGKMNSRFQKKLYKSIGKEDLFKKDNELEKLYSSKKIDEIPHGVLSAAFIDIPKLKESFDDIDIEVLASAVYNHHNRKVIDKNGQEIKDTDIKEIIEKDLTQYAEIYDKSIKPSFRGVKKNVVKENLFNNYEFWKKFIVIKGMLNKLDYAASAGLYVLEMPPNDTAECVENKFKKENWELKDCQEFMKNNNDKNLVVVASTGIGKTEGALLWAGNSKTFYTLPVKVSINAIYKRIKDEGYYGESEEDKEKVTFLHSDTRSMMLDEKEDIKEYENNFDNKKYEIRYLQTKYLAYPLTVCTIDQLFYFVFKSLGTEKFPATLKYSKVIIDEIQSYTADITAFIIYGLKVVSDLGGKFLIMTTTLPPVVKHFLKEEIGEKNLLIAEKPYFKRDCNGDIIQRHFIKYEERDFDYNDIVNNTKTKKVLVICNTVKRAQSVYDEIKMRVQKLGNKNNIDVNLLHSRFILKDRAEKEKKILEFASNDKDKRNNKTGVWISTQIVEASLDIDFDILYTDMATADSLLQRMGRCFRNRSYNESKPNIFIYKIEDEKSIGIGNVYDKYIFNFSAKCIKKYDNRIFSEEDKIKYIDEVYEIEKVKHTQYFKTIEENIKTLKELPVCGVSKETTEIKFRNINNITVIPASFYEELEEKNIFEKYDGAKGKEKLKIKEEILKYTTPAHYYFIKYCNTFSKKYKGLNEIYIAYLKYNKEYGLLNEKDDELEAEDRCF